MGFIATSLAKIPAKGFDWYLFVLTDSWEDPIQNELLKNFDKLSTAVGEGCLVVRGANPDSFYNSLLATELGKMSGINSSTPFPSLVLSSRSIADLDESRGKMDLAAH